jgi:hypothetical protein
MSPALLFLLTGIALVLLGVAPFAKEGARLCHAAAAILGVVVIVGAVLRF